jgi:hypothetical protein
VLASTALSQELQNDLQIGEISISTPLTSTPLKTVPLVLGKNISDIDYDMYYPTSCPKHLRAKLAFKHRQDVMYEFNYVRDVCDVTCKLDTPTSISEIRVTATTNPVDIFVSQAVLETSVGLKAVLPPISERFKVARSQDPRWRLWHRNSPPPFARMVPLAHPVSYRKMRNVTDQLTAPGYKMERDVFLNREEYTTDSLKTMNAPDPEHFRGSAQLVPTGNPRKFDIKTQSNQPGWLFVSQSWYDGWKALLDGAPTKLARATGAYMAVHVPAGQHEIRLSFRTPWLVPGAILSSLAALFSILVLLWPGNRRKPHPQAG